MFRCEMEHFPDIRFANCRVRSQVGEQGRAVVQLDLSEAHYWFLDWDQLSSAHSSVRTLHTLMFGPASQASQATHTPSLTWGQARLHRPQISNSARTQTHIRDMQLLGNRGWELQLYIHWTLSPECHIVKSIPAPGVIAYLIVDVVCKCTRCHVTDSFLVKYVSWVETLNHELPTSLFYPSSQLVWFTRVEKEF